jgi:hypothetical protein
MYRKEALDPPCCGITTFCSSSKKEGILRLKQVEIQFMPKVERDYEALRSDLLVSELSKPFVAASAAIGSLPSDVQADAQLQMSMSVSGSQQTQTTSVKLAITHSSLKSVLNSPTLHGLTETCDDGEEITVHMNGPQQGLFDCIALQQGFFMPYEGLDGAAQAWCGVQVPFRVVNTLTGLLVTTWCIQWCSLCTKVKCLHLPWFMSCHKTRLAGYASGFQYAHPSSLRSLERIVQHQSRHSYCSWKIKQVAQGHRNVCLFHPLYAILALCVDFGTRLIKIVFCPSAH